MSLQVVSFDTNTGWSFWYINFNRIKKDCWECSCLSEVCIKHLLGGKLHSNIDWDVSKLKVDKSLNIKQKAPQFLVLEVTSCEESFQFPNFEIDSTCYFVFQDVKLHFVTFNDKLVFEKSATIKLDIWNWCIYESVQDVLEVIILSLFNNPHIKWRCHSWVESWTDTESYNK